MILVKFVDRSDDVHWINIDQICSITPRSDSSSERKMSGSRMRVNGYNRSLIFEMSPEELTKYLQEEVRKAKYGLVGDIQTSSLEEVEEKLGYHKPTSEAQRIVNDTAESVLKQNRMMGDRYLNSTEPFRSMRDGYRG